MRERDRERDNGEAESEINNRDKLAWMEWKQLTDVLCDQRVTIELKDMVIKVSLRHL